jgi:hypothetical protein
MSEVLAMVLQHMTEVITAVLVIITGFYAWATYRILRTNENVVSEMQRQSEEIARPRISIFAHTLPSRPVFHLTIRNIGSSAASNLRLRLSKPFFEGIENKNLAPAPAFSKLIPNLGPDETIQFQLGAAFEIIGNGRDDSMRPLEFAIEADYWFGGKHYVETTHIDLGVQQMTSLTTDAIVEQMTYINKHLKDMLQVLQQLRARRD